jgi:hypothetical protein
MHYLKRDLGLIPGGDACSISTLIGGSVKGTSGGFNFVKNHSFIAPQIPDSHQEPDRALFSYQINKEVPRG